MVANGGKTLGIVAHRLATQLRIATNGIEILADVIEMHLGHIKHIAMTQHAIHRGRVLHPCRIINGTGIGRLSKLAEILRCLHIMLRPILSLIINVERSVVHLEHHRTERSLHGGLRIILRTPCHKILTVSRGETRRIVVHAKHKSPRAILRMNHTRVVHAFLASPLRIIRRTQLANIHPSLVISEISQVKTCFLARRIDKNLARRIIVQYLISGQRLLGFGLNCRTSSQDNQHFLHILRFKLVCF